VESLLANYYTATSVIIVYHLLSLEYWLSSVSESAENANEVSESTTSGDITRHAARSRCTASLRRFPYVQIILLFLAVGAMGALAIDVSRQLTSYRLIYTAGPAFILVGVFIVATIATYVRGHAAARGAMARL
jgi:hypothetical protein